MCLCVLVGIVCAYVRVYVLVCECVRVYSCTFSACAYLCCLVLMGYPTAVEVGLCQLPRLTRLYLGVLCWRAGRGSHMAENVPGRRERGHGKRRTHVAERRAAVHS